jgi:hypothetical protein
VIEINSPDYSVDIYQSSIRSVLWWPEVAPAYQEPPEPRRSDFVIDVKKFVQFPEYRKAEEGYPWRRYIGGDRATIHYIDRTEVYFTKTVDGEKDKIILLDVDLISSYANTIKSEHERVFHNL